MKESEGYHFPIVGTDGKYIGLTSLGEIRDTFYEEQMDQLVLAGDIVTESDDFVFQNEDLSIAMEMFKEQHIDYIPVIDDEASKKVVGQLELKKLIERIHKEVIIRQQELES